MKTRFARWRRGEVSVDALTGLRDPQSFIPEMESLRGWAILLVVAFHYYGLSLAGTGDPFYFHTDERDPFWLQIAAAGNTGVVLFFVLSGFLLGKPFVRALQGGSRVDVQRFYIARVVRIVPLYYAFVLLAWFATGNTEATIQALLFQPIGMDMFPYSVPWWTLATEVQFYLLLPWAMLLLRSQAGRWLVAGAVCIWLALHLYYFHDKGWLGNVKNWHLQGSLFGRGPAFLIGVGCAWFHGSRWYARLFANPPRNWGVLVTLLLGLYWLLRWYSTSGQLPALKAMPMFHNIEALFWGAILLCCMNLSGPGKILLINPVMSHFGVLSYSIYLVHVPVQVFCKLSWLEQVEPWIGSMSLATSIAVSFLLIWLISLATYLGLEKPCLRLKARMPIFTSKRQRQGVALEP